MDMLPLSTMSEERSPNQYLADVTQQNVERQRRSVEFLDPNAPETRDKWYATQVSNHEKLFPFSDKLFTLMFIVGETHKFPFSPGNECHCIHF